MRLRTLVWKILPCLFLLASPKILAGDLCGSKEGYLNQLTSTFIIPDYFPPETEVLKGLVANVDYEKCQSIASVPLGLSCQDHDRCYEMQTTKEQCDKAIQDSWIKQCRRSYYKLAADHFTCKLACEAFVKLMSEAQRYDSNGICPSCEAYNSLSN